MTRAPSAGWVPCLPSIVGLAAFLRVLAERKALLQDPDSYLHIAAGRWMLAHHALPARDPFSFSMAGARWVPHEWLAELVLAATFGAGGWPALMVLTAASFALAVALLTRRLLDHIPPLPAALVVVASAAILLPHLTIRPHALVLPLLVIWSAGLIAARDAGRPPSWRLIAVMVPWANLHGSFMAGLALAAFLGVDAALGDRRRAVAIAWGRFMLAAGLAALATPNFIDGFLLPLSLSAMPSLQHGFVEWRALDFTGFQPIELFLLGAVLLLATGIRVPVGRAILAVVLFYLALAHQRHADLVAVLVPLAFAASIGPAVGARMAAGRQSVIGAGFARMARPCSWRGTAAPIAVASAAGVLALINPVVRTDDIVTPTSALDAARAAGLTGNVFNDEGFGGFLLFSGVPTFIDGRIELYGDEFLRRYLAAEGGDASSLSDSLGRYRIGWAMLTPASRAAALLSRMPGWRLVHGDAVAVLYARSDAPAGGPALQPAR